MRSTESSQSRRLGIALLLSATVSGTLACGTLGCNNSSSRGAAVVIPPVSVNALLVVPDPDATQIQYSLVSPNSHPMSVRVEISENLGLSFEAATVTQQMTGQEANPNGVSYSISWIPSADLTSLDQGDLIVRLTPTDDVTGVAGQSAQSLPFALGRNTPPSIAAVTTPVGVQGGEILIDYELLDLETDHASVLLEFSLDSGATWAPATIGTGGDGATPLASSLTGTPHSLAWRAQADAPNFVGSTVKLKLTPIDTATGTSGQSNNFTVNLISPEIEKLTLGDIPSNMNGSQPYSTGSGSVNFHLSVPASGFTLTVDCRTAAGGNLLDLSTLSVTANQPLGPWDAGTDFGAEFDFVGAVGSWIVPSTHAAPFAEVVFSATIADVLGNRSPVAELFLRVIPAGPAELPFDTVDLWWLDFNADQFTISSIGSSTISVSSSPGGNGVADYIEDLEILGLQSAETTGVESDLNAIVLEWLQSETLGRLRELYGGSYDGSVPGYNPNIQFTQTPGGHRSAIRVGGDDSVPGYTVGRAQFDYRNAFGNVNASPTLGIFTTNLIEFYINTSFTFKARFDPLIPSRGTPVGEDPLDGIVLHSSFNRFAPTNTLAENGRYDSIAGAVDAFARSVAVILAHEVGHSIGLVANGTPPSGLFGGVTDAPFAGVYTNSFHVDTPGSNIMAAALSFSSSLVTGSSGYSFNELTQEYIRETVLLSN